MTAPRRPYRIGCLVRGWWEHGAGVDYAGLFRVVDDDRGVDDVTEVRQSVATNQPESYHVEPLIPLSALQELLDDDAPSGGLRDELRRVIDREVYGDG